jgi:superfamily I DNA/RNA helicase
LKYEKWKSQNNSYDMMDLVGHLMKSGSGYYSKSSLKMDYLMVDEVQDLTPKTLQLLIRLTRHKVFFAGDTA